MASVIGAINPWAWKPHPEVWVLVLAILLLGRWAVKGIGPKVVASEKSIVTNFQKTAFLTAVLLLFLSADWPVHDVAEDHLYSVHMFQHLVITFIVPPLFLLSIPRWLAELVVLDSGRGSRILRRASHPVLAGVVFNALVALTHWGGIVQASADSGIFHYSVHLLLFVSAIFMWVPVVSPLPELRLSPLAQMLYLFLMSIIPTVPAAWLTFAEGTVYSHYDDGYQMWGISVQSDQQAAGFIMKLVGGFYLWGIIIFKFFKIAGHHRENQTLRPASPKETNKDEKLFNTNPLKD